MIISHRHQFILLKTAKTAGTSVEIALSKLCGPDDVIAPVAPPDEALRRKLGCRGPQHYAPSMWRYGWREWRYVMAARKRPQFFNHIPAWRIKKLVDRGVWDDYFKFCYERNPWDRAISWYYWRHPNGTPGDISRFLASGALGELRAAGSGVYTIDGQIVADRVCRFERLSEDFAEVYKRVLGLSAIPELPRTKAEQRTDRRHYREILSSADRDRIAAEFSREIAWFGYEF